MARRLSDKDAHNRVRDARLHLMRHTRELNNYALYAGDMR